MRAYFRLLPLTILFAVMLLGVKIYQGVNAGQDVFSALFFSSVVAQEEEQAQEPQEAPQEEAPEENTQENAEPTAEGEEAQVPDEAKEEEEEAEDDGVMGGFLEFKEKKLTAEDLIGNQLGGVRPSDRRFSPLELQVLQQLAERRKDLDAREEQVVLKETLLTQTENRIDEKFQEMQTLKSELAEVIAQYKEVEETKIQSLVKIYENMKPKDAARIFDELEMPVLIMVIDKMKEKKAAPILAGMSPQKAKMLTVELAEKRRAEDEKERRMRMQQ